jgi:hypothetical protein
MFMKIILTVDYELFGNGSGSCEACRINPTTKMAELASGFSIPLTFFVDYGELRRKKAEIKNNKDKKTEDGMVLTEEQLKTLISSGHDVQFHLHPQWLKAQKGKNDRWEVCPELESIAKLEDLTELTFPELFQESKDYFEKLLKPVNGKYECYAFRAGAWAIQPSQPVLEGLSDAGFKIDSSVFPGMKKTEEHYNIDYSAAPIEKDYWGVRSDVCSPAEQPALLEIPIASNKASGIQRLFTENILQRFLGKGYAPGCEGTSFSKSSLFKRLKKLIKANYHAVDFCHYRPGKLIKYLKKRREKGFEYTVLIGHTKEFSSPESFRQFLQTATRNEFEFTTFEALKDVL